jgi:hypothetical protein
MPPVTGAPEMMTANQNQYAPRTRVGLLISCVGFAVLALSTAIPAISTVITPTMGLGFVLTILLIVYVPRMIRPGQTWLTTPLPHGFATAVFASAGIIGLASVTASMSTGHAAWGVAGSIAITIGAVLVACAPRMRDSTVRH